MGECGRTTAGGVPGERAASIRLNPCDARKIISHHGFARSHARAALENYGGVYIGKAETI
jgi:hypothetical protein